MRFPISVRLGRDSWITAHAAPLWAAINKRFAARPFTAAELAKAIGSRQGHGVEGFLRAEVRAGRLAEPAPGRFELGAGPAAMPAALGDEPGARQQQQMWNILRGPEGRRGLDAAGLAMRSATEQCPVSLEAARDYLAVLVDGRFAHEVQPGVFKLWTDRLARPEAPLLMVARFILDPNDWTVSRLVREAAVVTL